MLYDTGSSGGTSINGERITERELRAGDVISLAGYTMVFGEDTPSGSEPPIRLEDTPAME
jgi:pSer/pThr/pTyr-binding forkhead associated (FHA) protein